MTPPMNVEQDHVTSLRLPGSAIGGGSEKLHPGRSPLAVLAMSVIRRQAAVGEPVMKDGSLQKRHPIPHCLVQPYRVFERIVVFVMLTLPR
jgi:hypothetical protein